MATFHENLVQSFHNFRDKYLKANGKYFKFSYDQNKQKYGYTIDNKFNEFGKTDSGNNYLECSTARSTAAKVVTATDFTLDVGTIIAVRFTDTGTSNPSSGNLTLNVGNTGAKTIVDGHTNKTVVTYSSGVWFYNNLVNEFVYDGTYWVWLNRDNNTTYNGGSLYTSVSKTGSGTTVTNTIASGTSMNNAIGTLLNNDAALNNDLSDKANASDFAVDTQTFTPDSATHGDLYGNIRFKRSGHVVTVEFHGFKSLADQYENTVLPAWNIRSAFRPNENVTFMVTGGASIYRAIITSDGALIIYPYNGIAEQNNVSGTFCYIVN